LIFINKPKKPKIMIKKQLHTVASAMALTLFSYASYAQDTNVSQRATGENGQPNLITFTEKATLQSSDFHEVFKSQLGLKENQVFSKIKAEIDPLGFTHEKFQLYHQGLKVEFATYSLHSQNGKLESMSGEFYDIDAIDMKATLSTENAYFRAISHIGAKQYLWENKTEADEMNYQKPEGELVLLPIIGGQTKQSTATEIRLAYKFDIYATNPVSRGDLYIDAKTGEVLLYNATIKHIGEHTHGDSTEKPESFDMFAKPALVVAANAATRYSGTQSIETILSGTSYILSDTSRGNGIQTYNMKKGTNYSAAVNFTDVDNNWTAAEFDNANKDNAALDAHWGAEKTYDYWSTVHGRNSYNNAGAKINSYVHYNSAYNNAFWNGSRMTYGDGSGTGGFDALTSLDVCAHEIGHAVCTSTANLTYSYESGAMNEGFSDIWAACVEHFAMPIKSIWLIGEEIDLRSGSVSLRSMSNPNANSHPDTYKGTFWNGTSSDNGGVHTNSGVLNHWFYILAVGQSGTNDIGSVYNVTGITIEKAAKIAYRTESVYLTASSNFAAGRTAAIKSATDLYGAASPEVIATTNAWYAVGVGAAYSGGTTDTTPPSTPLSLVASGTTGSSTNLSWTASTDNVAVTGYNVYNGTTLLTTLTGTSGTVSGLAAATTYSLTIKAKDAAGNLSASSNAVSVTTLTASITYCTAASTNTNDERISKVVFGTINNTSTGTAGYENFTAQSTNVTSGTAYTITITPTWTGTIYSEGYGVWIDYNKNGLFTDAGELVFSQAATKTTPVSGNVTIPATAAAGATRMRVAMKYNSIPTSCGSFTYGQVEDYTVNVGSATITEIAEITATQKTFDFNLYPSPVEEILNVSVAENSKATYSIYNLVGQEMKSGNLNQNTINVASFEKGVYIFEVNDGEKTVTKKFVKK
jgi:bacillolysin